MAETNNSPFLTELYIVLLAVASAALVIAVYHCLSVIRWNQRQIQRMRGRRGGVPQENEDDPYRCSTVENSMVELIPAHKHTKNLVLDGEEDGTCPICLSEFEEGEELRTLPECLHSFHAACIDMWFYSHFNCPMCRTDATPSPSPRIQIVRISDSVPVASMTVEIDVQSMSV